MIKGFDMIHKQVVIIGAGVTGCAIARELSRQKLDILVLEKNSDVCEGTSKANSGIVHAGYDAKPGTLKARLNVEGNRLMSQLSKTLDFPFKNNGSMVLCFDEADRPALEELCERGRKNGVEGVRIIEAEEIHKLEPNVTDDVACALWAPTGGIVCPFNLTIALAENAVVNGVEFSLDAEVTDIRKAGCDSEDGENSDGYVICVTHYPNIKNRLSSPVKEEIHADIVINAAGVYADVFHNMVSDKKIHITPRKGEYVLLDKKVGNYVSSTIFQLPTAKGKGVLVTPTVHGNLLVGPTATDEDSKDLVDTSSQGLAAVVSTGGLSVKELPSRGNIITSFAGLRAHEDNGDFVIGQASGAPGFVDVAGIESPGLSCAPALGKYVADMICKIYPSEKKDDFVEERVGITSMALADDITRQSKVDENPAYAHVVCRCELVTEGEMVAAINRPLGATTLDGVKRRTRAGMGRCQAGFCTPKQMQILARELGVDIADITKKGGAPNIGVSDRDSNLLTGYPKGGESHE